MPTEPGITLTVTLQDLSGVDVDGGALLIRLCGYGQTLPRIVGTSMLAKISTKVLLANGSSAGISLWGNDQITPAGTYYAIEVLDSNRNIVQAGIYQLNGAQTIDLSNATQLDGQPAGGGGGGGGAPGAGSYNTITADGDVAIGSTGAGVQTFDITLAANSTLTSMSGFARGTIVNFIIRQPPDDSAAYTWTWPGFGANGFTEPPPVSQGLGIVTQASFLFGTDALFRPLSGGTYTS